jgi:hypothetical protein
MAYQEPCAYEGARARVAPVQISSSSLVSGISPNDDDSSRARSSSFLETETGMSAPTAAAVAARLSPGQVRDWIEAAKYLGKREPAGWIYGAVVRNGAIEPPREYLRHREALEAKRRRLELEQSEIAAQRAKPPPPAEPDRPPMAPGATRAGLPAELRRRWAQKAASE